MVFNLIIELEKEKQKSEEIYKKLNALIDSRISSLSHQLLSDFGKYFEDKGFKTMLVNATIMRAELGSIQLELNAARNKEAYVGVLSVLDLKISGVGSRSGKYSLFIDTTYNNPSGLRFGIQKSEEERIKEAIEEEKKRRENVLKRIEEFEQEKWVLKIQSEKFDYETKYHDTLSECLDELLGVNTP
jgi:hypothetical protein